MEKHPADRKQEPVPAVENRKELQIGREGCDEEKNG